MRTRSGLRARAARDDMAEALSVEDGGERSASRLLWAQACDMGGQPDFRYIPGTGYELELDEFYEDLRGPSQRLQHGEFRVRWKTAAETPARELAFSQIQGERHVRNECAR